MTIAAAETAEPQKAVAKATNSVITRVLVFYVGSIFLVACLVPWNAGGIATPYVSALNTMGVPAAAQIMNAIVLTAVLSALNSGLYASSRMLFALTRRGDAPQALAKVSRNGVPTRAILVATLFGYGAVVMSYVSPDKVFAFLVNSYGTVAIFVYILIAISQLRLRARLEREAPHQLKVRMWCYPYLTWFAIFGMLSIVIAMAFIPEQRTPLALGVASLCILLLAYAVRQFLQRGVAPVVTSLSGLRGPSRRSIDPGATGPAGPVPAIPGVTSRAAPHGSHRPGPSRPGRCRWRVWIGSPCACSCRACPGGRRTHRRAR